jgi:hypothetical protein
MPRLAKISMSVFVVSLLALFAWQQHRLIENQRAEMKQQFHSDGIALVSLFGDDGLAKLRIATDPKELSYKESFATGLLLQRFISAYWIRNAFTAEEWQEMVIKDGQETMRSPLLRARWQQVRMWYPKEIRDFFEKKLLVESK